MMKRIAYPTLLAALAVASLSVSACSGHTCPQVGNSTSVQLPEAQSSPIASASTDPPCTASGDGADRVTISRSSAGSCEVVVQLANGDTYAVSVTLTTFHVGGCGDGLRIAGSPNVLLVDGGADGAS